MSELRIEAGKFYRTRDGRKVGPMVAADGNFKDDRTWQFRPGAGERWPDHPQVWRPNGKVYMPMGGYEDVDTLVAEWVDEPASPVRTRTVTEIVPGGYSGVRVDTYDDTRVRIGMQHTIMDAAYLRAAAAVFVQLADALEGGAA